MKSNNSIQNIQGILSLGYVYLVLLGIFHEAIFYTQIGINYLSYSTILDMLISPIASLTSSVPSIITCIVILFLLLILPGTLAKKRDVNWVKKIFKLEGNTTEDEATSSVFNWFLVIIIFMLAGFFFGRGIGGGARMAKKIKNKEIKYTDELTFLTGESETVHILGKNSAYIFYLETDSDKPKVSPINGTIKSILEVNDEEDEKKDQNKKTK